MKLLIIIVVGVAAIILGVDWVGERANKTPFKNLEETDIQPLQGVKPLSRKKRKTKIKKAKRKAKAFTSKKKRGKKGRRRG